MSPDEVELHAISAKRQLEHLGRDSSHIDPVKLRSDAEERARELASPITKADAVAILGELAEIRKLLSRKTTITNNIHVEDGDGFKRSQAQIARTFASIR